MKVAKDSSVLEIWLAVLTDIYSKYSNVSWASTEDDYLYKHKYSLGTIISKSHNMLSIVVDNREQHAGR